MEPRLRNAHTRDVPALVALMAEFYGEADYPLPRDAAARAFTSLLGDPARGLVWILEIEAEAMGYLVLSLGFSMEYGGLRGWVDDFFVRPPARGRGLGRAALATVREACREMGVRALLVEAGPESHPARRVYARAGFEDSGRVVLTQALAPPLHES